MKSQWEIFREIYSESKKGSSLLRFLDAVEKFENKYEMKAPYKNLESFQSATSRKLNKVN